MMKKNFIVSLFVALVLCGSYTSSAFAKYDAAKEAVESALSHHKSIEFSDLYEITPDLHGVSSTPDYKRTFVCGYVAYEEPGGKHVRVRFIYVAHSEDPALADYGPLTLEKPDLTYGILDEGNGGRYATVFEFSGWNRICVDARHPKTFSGVAPKSDG
ncbi:MULTISPECIES: hypothetical protein [Burkholderia]|uniref:hypothetical protein n=1 Tax=Burkholderia TaxID=32008 RepID=UPI00075D9BA4|nr:MULTISPECIES: hypothetical protein [Burkholderia]KVM61504.1 hypothetical protein WJ59_28245 [Burkholderia gladioli]NBI46871.1 hypothetical protein [Burkholderia sp. ISTR5]